MKGRTRLYFVRHGETKVSSEFRYIGHLDVDINETGEAQMLKLRERFKKEEVTYIYCSDLIRAKRGADIIASPHAIKPIPCIEFREIHLGIWEGKTREEIMEFHSEEFYQRLKDLSHTRIEGGESFKDLQVRVMNKLNLLLKKHPGETLLLVAHGGVNRVILCDALQLDLHLLPRIDQAYGCVNIIDYYDDGPVVRLVNG